MMINIQEFWGEVNKRFGNEKPEYQEYQKKQDKRSDNSREIKLGSDAAHFAVGGVAQGPFQN